MKFFWIFLFFSFLNIKLIKAEEKPFFIKCKNPDNTKILDFKINKDNNLYTTVFKKIKNKVPTYHKMFSLILNMARKWWTRVYLNRLNGNCWQDNLEFFHVPRFSYKWCYKISPDKTVKRGPKKHFLCRVVEGLFLFYAGPKRESFWQN